MEPKTTHGLWVDGQPVRAEDITDKNQHVRHGSALKNSQKTEQGSEYKTLRWMSYLNSKGRGGFQVS